MLKNNHRGKKSTTVALCVLAILAVSLLFPKAITAHLLKSDGPIGAVIHLDPDDDPIIGQDATFFLEFKDKENRFSLKNCTCNFKISKDNQEVFSTALSPTENTSNTAASFSYIFKKKGVYTLAISGSSIDDSFPNFNLVYDWRVARDRLGFEPNFLTENLHLIIIGSAVLLFLGIILSCRIRTRAK